MSSHSGLTNENTGSFGSCSVEELRALLAQRLAGPLSRPEAKPLSFAQQRLWFLDQLEPGSPRYNMPSVCWLKGALDVAALERALAAVHARHESLRTRFLHLHGEPAQVVDGALDFTLPQVDLPCPEGSDGEEALNRFIGQEVSRPFCLHRDRLFRALLIRLAPDEYVLVICMHHIVSDEWSFGIFYQELGFFYSGFVEGRAVSLPALPIQYTDYAAWQHEWLRGPQFEQQLAFWTQHLEGNPPAVELPTDCPRQAATGARAGTRWRSLDVPLAEALQGTAHRERVTLFMLLLAAFKVLLYRYTHQNDIIVGTPFAGRNRVETEGLIGFFVNTLPLRTRLSGEMTFRDVLAQVRRSALGAYSNPDLPFEKLVEALKPERQPNQTPFVQVMFMLQQASGAAFQLPKVQCEFLPSAPSVAKFDLTLTMQVTPDGIGALAQFNADLFAPTTIQRFLEHFENLLQGLVKAPSAKVSELPLLGEAERRQILLDWNATATPYPRHRCVHELFEEQARATPGAQAVTCAGRSLTYAELDAQANQVAHYLKRAGVSPGSVVAICLERSLDLIISLLGILKAGAAYAGLDPLLPEVRLKAMLHQLQPPVVLTQSLWKISVGNSSAPRTSLVICLDAEWEEITQESPTPLPVSCSPDNLAYVSFTSGSTGRPKGVCVPHRAVVRLVKNTRYIDFSARDVFLHFAPISFDASTFEIWGALLNGAHLVLVPPGMPSLSELADLIQEHQVTVAWLTSGLFNQLVDENVAALKPLRQLLTGGDVLSPAHIRKALSSLESCRLINGYGPTENTTFTTCYTIPSSFPGDRPVPIGRPISNTTCYILDEHRQPVPLGVPGELYAGGDGLATGYWQDPELTAEKFVPNPFQPGTRLYRTGDLARYLPDGTIEFLGRIDHQVKIRGFRVEPGETETVLNQHPQVRQSLVLPRTNQDGLKVLLAYVVRKPTADLGEEDLLGYLRKALPDYMIPSRIVFLENLPLNQNGKVDRAALPAPGEHTKTEFIAPRTENETRLQRLWEEVLNARPIGVRDKFFSLGGHSLLAVRLMARVEKEFGRKTPVATLFKYPTIEELARCLEDEEPLAVCGASSMVEIQPQGNRLPLFLVHGVGGGMFWGYHNLAKRLGQEQPIYAFKSRGLEGEPEYETIEEMAEAYVAELKRFRKKGPYLLGGYCFGGVVAFEMARRLQMQGEQVPVLALINSNAPNSTYTQFEWNLPLTWGWSKNLCRRTLLSLRSRPDRLCEHVCWKAKGMLKKIHSKECSWDVTDQLNLSQYTEEQRKVWAAHVEALGKYHPKPYEGDLYLFRSPVHLLFCSFAHDYGWGPYVRGKVAVKLIPAMHETIMEEPSVQALASELESCLKTGSPTFGRQPG